MSISKRIREIKKTVKKIPTVDLVDISPDKRHLKLRVSHEDVIYKITMSCTPKATQTSNMMRDFILEAIKKNKVKT